MTAAAQSRAKARARAGARAESKLADAAPAEIELVVSVRCGEWRRQLPGLRRLALSAARATVKGVHGQAGAGLFAPCEIGIVFADDAFVRGLNRQYRGRDRATNVLSFPCGERADGAAAHGSGECPLNLGDIVLARETVAREARDGGKPLADHTRHLIVHGILHLLGYDHDRSGPARIMEGLEAGILRGLGVTNPHEVETGHG